MTDTHEIEIKLQEDECRICYDVRETEVVRPCKCQSKVHRECLQRWRATNERVNKKCEICNYEYRFEYSYKTSWFTDRYFKYTQETSYIISRSFQFFLLHSLIFNVFAGIIFGCDTSHSWAAILGLYDTDQYRAYYGTVFLFAYFIYELLIFSEIIRMSCSNFVKYCYWIICKVKSPHICMLITLTYSTILYGTTRHNVFLDIPSSIFFLFAHLEIHMLAMKQLCKGRVYHVANYSE